MPQYHERPPMSHYVKQHVFELIRNRQQIGPKNDQEIYRVIAQSVNDAIIVLDRQGNITLWNPAASQIFGYDQNEAMGQAVHTLIGANQNNSQIEHKEVMGKTTRLEVVHKNGHRFPIELSLVSARNTENDDDIAIGIVRDVSQQVDFEEALITGRRNLENFIENVKSGVVITDSCTIVTVWNPEQEKLTGLKKEDAIGRPIIDIQIQLSGFEDPDGSIRKGFELIYTEILKSGEIPEKYQRMEYALIDAKGNSKVISANVICYRDHTGIHIASLSADITEQKKLEQRLVDQSFKDTLTGVYNRNYYQNEVEKLHNSRNEHDSVIFIDLDNLKIINDTQGHSAGDEQLVEIAKILQNTARAGDTVARFGGDEFVMLLPGVSESDLQKIIKRLSKISSLINNPPQFSIGFATTKGPDDTIKEAITRADQMMYLNKSSRKQKK